MASCHKHMRELSKVVTAITPDHEITVSRGNHLQVVIRHGSETRKLYSAKTPSDHRALLNFKATVRKAFLEMTGPKEPRF